MKTTIDTGKKNYKNLILLKRRWRIKNGKVFRAGKKKNIFSKTNKSKSKIFFFFDKLTGAILITF